MKRYLIPSAIVVLLISAFVLVGFMGSVKVGFLDMQKIVSESKVGKESAAELQEFIKERNGFAESKRMELQSLIQEIEALRKNNIDKGLKDKEQVLEARKNEFGALVQQSRAEIQAKDRELTQKLLPDVIKIVKDIGTKEGYTMIVDVKSGQVLYNAESGDLSGRIMSRLDQ